LSPRQASSRINPAQGGRKPVDHRHAGGAGTTPKLKGGWPSQVETPQMRTGSRFKVGAEGVQVHTKGGKRLIRDGSGEGAKERRNRRKKRKNKEEEREQRKRKGGRKKKEEEQKEAEKKRRRKEKALGDGFGERRGFGKPRHHQA